MAIYILFVDSETMATKLEELNESDPELFDDFPLKDVTEGLRETDSPESELGNQSSTPAFTHTVGREWIAIESGVIEEPRWRADVSSSMICQTKVAACLWLSDCLEGKH